MKKDKASGELARIEKFEWDVVDFNNDYLWLQIRFQNPEDIGSFTSKDFISVTFWDIELFKSFQGIEVEMGTEIFW